MSIVVLDFQIGITLETAIFIIVVSVVLYVVSELFVTVRNRHRRKVIEVTSKSICKRKNTKQIFVIISFALLMILSGSSYILYENSLTEIPGSLVEFGRKYPEAQQFVTDYHKYKNMPWNQELHLNVREGEIPLFIQWDKRWGYQYYGNDLLGIRGCGPTCISMVLCGLNGNDEWNPYRVAMFSEKNGYDVPGVGTSWDLMSDGAEMLGLNSEKGNITKDYIMNNLSVSSPMICSMGPGDFTYTGHFIVLVGIDTYGDIIVNDPNSKRNSTRHWDLDILIPQIQSIWKYQLL